MRVQLLGPLAVEHDGRPVEVGGARLRALLACLALEPGRAVRVEALVEAVWDNDLPADEAHSLQSLVSRLRRTLGDSELVPAAPGGYRLDVAPDDVDASRFTRLAADGGAALGRGEHAAAAALLREALALWHGPALADVPAHRFAVAATSTLEGRRVAALADRIDADLALGEAVRLVPELEALQAEHPLNERFAAQLMTALFAAGRQADALAAYERVRTALDAELGVAPSPALQAAHLAVLRGDVAPAAPATEPPPPPARRSNLTAPLTSFVGREEEIARIDALLGASRLVTIVGPGGAGKTRLSREATGRWVDRVADGVWLVELAPITEAIEIVPTVLGAMGLRDVPIVDRPGHRSPRDGIERLLDVLADREAIVILDNCEHLIAPTAELVETLLGACPRLRIVATSREPLAITGESLAPVPPLAMPAPGADAQEAIAHPAVRLFADRAAAVQPGFAVDARTVDAVIEICRRLDGLPLAIELAAARLRSMPIEEIARRLDDRFRLLTGGSRTALPRHRTLRAVVDWSWELLDERERRLARRLAVFAGGATTESATAVCGFDGLDPADVPDGLAALVERSLLQVVPGSEPPRHRMLETIREYGLEQLGAAAEVEPVRAAHAAFFADLAAEADPYLRGPDQRWWYRRLDGDRDNVLAALRWLGDTGDAAGALRLVVDLLWFWLLSASRDESNAWMAFALEVPGGSDPVDRLVIELIHRMGQQDHHTPEGREILTAQLAGYLERLVALDDGERPLLAVLKPAVAVFSQQDELAMRYVLEAQGHPDPWVRAATLMFAGAKAENEGDPEATRENLAAALRAFDAVGDRWAGALVLTLEAGRRVAIGDLDGAEDAALRARSAIDELSPNAALWVMDMRLADVALRRGDLVAAREHSGRVIADASIGGEDRVFAEAQLAIIEIVAGDLAAAHRALTTPVQRLRSTHPDHGSAVALAARATLALHEGDAGQAAELLPIAHEAAVATTDMPVVGAVGLAVAELAVGLGDAEAAAEILGAAAVLRGGDDPTHPLIIALRDRLRAELGDAGLAGAYRRGRAMTREEAVARTAPVASDAPAVGA